MYIYAYLSISLSSLTSCKLGDDDTVYYVVGTGIVHPEEVEPKVGRLVIFTWADGKLTQVCFIYIYTYNYWTIVIHLVPKKYFFVIQVVLHDHDHDHDHVDVAGGWEGNEGRCLAGGGLQREAAQLDQQHGQALGVDSRERTEVNEIMKCMVKTKTDKGLIANKLIV